MYVVFSYDTNLGADDWLKKGFKRLAGAANEVKGKLNLIDVVYVLRRGMIRSAKCAGKVNDDDQMYTFLEFYLHLVS